MSPEAGSFNAEKIRLLLVYCDELAAALQSSPATPLQKRASERLFQLIVECVGDLGMALAVSEGWPVGGSTRDSIRTAREKEWFPEEAARHFEERYVALRDRIIHDYERLDSTIVSREAIELVKDGRAVAQALMKRMAE